MTASPVASGDTGEVEGADVERQFQQAHDELTELDDMINDIQDELKRFGTRREILASREMSLRVKCTGGNQGQPKVFTMHPGGEEHEVPPPILKSREDEWERGLESLGVAKCGVCQLKFPLDVGAIEQHCLECKGRSGAKPSPAKVRREKSMPPKHIAPPEHDEESPKKIPVAELASQFKAMHGVGEN